MPSDSLTVAVCGFGRMGHQIAAVAADRGHRVAATIDPNADDASHRTLNEAIESGAVDADTVTIDFSLAGGVPGNVEAVASLGGAIVIGTTGWEADREAVLERARSSGTALVYGSNFSVGAQLFMRVAAFAARLSERTDGAYDAALWEIHHRGKADSPSGTAKSIAGAVMSELGSKTGIQAETLHRTIEPNELHVASLRVGSVPGTHTVLFDSDADSIELAHRARNRGGFALGAVQAAEWLATVGGVHEVEDFFAALFGGTE